MAVACSSNGVDRDVGEPGVRGKVEGPWPAPKCATARGLLQFLLEAVSEPSSVHSSMPRHAAPLAIAFLAVWTVPGMVPPDRVGSASGSEEGTAQPAGSLPFFYDLYSFRGDSGVTDVVASFAVPAGNLDHDNVDGNVRYRFSVTFVLADTALGLVSRADDSVFVSVERPLAGEHLLHSHVETGAAPSRTTVQRVVVTDASYPGTGQLYTHAYEVPDYGGEALMLSDIALGLPERSGGWRRGDVTLALLPRDRLPSGVFDVYYEVYNLTEGGAYRTEISIEPLRGPDPPRLAGDRSVRVSFAGESAAEPGEALPELRRLDASLADGPYRLTVTVTDEITGQTARRETPLVVRKWEEGATLVPTCPVTPRVSRPDCPEPGRRGSDAPRR
jgi:hypothetical protein